MTNYTPISCSYYDELEAFAIKKELVSILYKDNNSNRKTQDLIINFYIKNKVEYMLLKSGTSIRLDHIISVNDKKLGDKNYC